MKNRNELIRKALDAGNVSQKQLADELGLSRAWVNERLNGDKTIDSVDFLKAVSKLTHTPLQVFIDMPDLSADDDLKNKYIQSLENQLRMVQEQLEEYKRKEKKK